MNAIMAVAITARQLGPAIKLKPTAIRGIGGTPLGERPAFAGEILRRPIDRIGDHR